MVGGFVLLSIVAGFLILSGIMPSNQVSNFEFDNYVELLLRLIPENNK